MSETDDTDDLLLIPPDFFLTNPLSDNPGPPYYNVVDSLITQLSNIEHRLNYIESSPELSLVSDSSVMYSPKKYQSTSSQNTPQKPRNKFTMSSLPNTPDLKKSPFRSRKSCDVSPMRGEIDHFLSNVHKIKRMNTVRNLENEFAAHPVEVSKNDFLKDLDVAEMKEKQIEREKLWHVGDHSNAGPDYGYATRKNMYSDSRQTDSSVEKNDGESSSEDTQMTAFERRNYTQQRGQRPRENGDFNLGLVSLAKLWNKSDVNGLPSTFQQKLEEERLRRQHCEQAIQDLQNRILELQERIAVAIQVDEAKDKAISRFHESWEKAGTKLQDVKKEKEALQNEIETLRKKWSEETTEINQKISYYEKEASKALNLAHSSREKLALLEEKYMQLEDEYKTIEINSEEFQKSFLAEAEKNRRYPEILAQKELELNECRNVLAEAKEEISQSKKAVEICQSEVSSMKSENDSLEGKLDGEKEANRKLNEQKLKLLEEINAHKSISKGFQDELTKTRDQLETNKVELKNFYQGQVEIVVQNKLKDFQNQLDGAEKALREELSKKELHIAKTAANHIQQISEKHTLEIKLLEEKHQEECRLYQLQIAQLRHELNDATSKIKRQYEKHVHIEKQLHKFMESLRQDHVTTLDEVNTFRSKSFSNLEEILSMTADHVDKDKIGETPISSRNEKGARRKEGAIQETIQMLLDKRSGGGDERDLSREGAFYQKMIKDLKGGKPPWK